MKTKDRDKKVKAVVNAEDTMIRMYKVAIETQLNHISKLIDVFPIHTLDEPEDVKREIDHIKAMLRQVEKTLDLLYIIQPFV